MCSKRGSLDARRRLAAYSPPVNAHTTLRPGIRGPLVLQQVRLEANLEQIVIQECVKVQNKIGLNLNFYETKKYSTG